LRKPGPAELCLQFLKADALVVGCPPDGDLSLPAWLQKHPIESLGPGNADAVFLLGDSAPATIPELLAGLELASDGGILIFHNDRLKNGDLKSPGLATGLKLLYHDRTSRLTVLEKERQYIKSSGHTSITLGFICCVESDYSFSNVRASADAWLEFMENNFRPEVFDFILVNDHLLSNEEQHALNKRIRLIHHFQPRGKNEALKSIIYNSAARYIFMARHILPESSWPLLHALLACAPADYVEAIWPPEAGRQRQPGPLAGAIHWIKQKAGLQKPRALDPPVFALARRMAYELRDADFFAAKPLAASLKKIKASRTKIEITG
jgi:hypothetical protein